MAATGRVPKNECGNTSRSFCTRSPEIRGAISAYIGSSFEGLAHAPALIEELRASQLLAFISPIRRLARRRSKAF
jgi:hypothetical protein